MTAPVIKLLLQQYPELKITYVSNGFVQPIFKNIGRLEFIAADLNTTHKGAAGLFRLYRQLKELKPGAIADLHNVLRTKLLRGYFFFSGIKTAVIDKGRKEKAELTKIDHKQFRPLKSTFERYAEVFQKLGYPIAMPLETGTSESNKPAAPVEGNFRYKIGIAPFAKHLPKQYPADKMREVIAMLNKDNDKEIFLFGGKDDREALSSLENEFVNVTNLACKQRFENELDIIASLDLMVSMDSANMHLASLFDVPVVSIWGGTHPFAGFYGWKQDPANAVQTDLYCRPCSVFGNRPCYRGDLACMHSINPVTVYDRIIQQLYKSSSF
jgi:ADP-heptose:LPS heptosyltransferase